MVNRPKVCILTGFGINTDLNIEHAFDLAGADSEIVHLNDLIENSKNLNDYHILAIPGGFSFGDDISAGKIFSVKFKSNLSNELKKFISEGKLVIGAGNGFQILVKMGFLPDIDSVQNITLSHNDSGKFENRWVHLAANSKSPCIFTKGVEGIYLPVKSGEGKFIAKDSNVLKSIEKNNLVALRYSDNKGKPSSKYPLNPTGSANNIAGICDKTGRVFGLMVQPELCILPTDNPEFLKLKKTPSEGDGLKIFKNGVNYANSKLLRK